MREKVFPVSGEIFPVWILSFLVRWIYFSSASNEARVEEPNHLILFRMLPGGERLELVFSLRGGHSRSRSCSRGSKRQRECFGSTRVTDGPLFKYREHSRPVAATGPRKTHLVSMTMTSDDYTVALKTTLTSARGETAASSPDRWQTMTQRILLVQFKK